ncbi:unnamed protein product [Leptosia nina]|uniref:Uncharacterized protein n=1 Tax=Leptosia nina TaxID=320188 RepID=A0AAV1JBH1_9NEOP
MHTQMQLVCVFTNTFACRRYYNATPLFASENASSEVWSAGGGGGSTACGSSGMDLKHEVAYRGLTGQVKAEPGVSHNGHPINGHVRDWMAGGGGSPSPGAAQPQPNGYSSPLSSSSYGPYSPNGKIEPSDRRSQTPSGYTWLMQNEDWYLSRIVMEYPSVL